MKYASSRNLKNHIKQPKWFLALVLIFMSVVAFSQGGAITGKVVDSEGEAVSGATVQVQGTEITSVTDGNGEFSLSASLGSVIEVSSAGYAAQSKLVDTRTNFEVTLVGGGELEEVIVIGYGTQKKSHLTGAISKVTNDQLDQMPLSRADDALVGRVSGVNIQATGGDGNDQGVGSAPQIRVRGTGSITGNSGPLLVVDGTVVDADFWSNIDMNDVESFEVLKDAASASIFGSRGANGVIMITTKQGKAGKTKFSYNSFFGFQYVNKNPDYNMTAAESFRKEIEANGELSDRSKVKQSIIEAAGGETNWQDVIFDGGLTQSHSISARGGNDKMKFSTVFTYFHDEGVLVTDDLKRYNLKANIEAQVTKRVKIGLNLNPSYSERRRFDGSTHDILRQTPWQPIYLDENTIKFANRVRDNGKYADAKIGDYAQQRMFDDYNLTLGAPDPTGSGTDVSNTSNTSPLAKVLERDRRDFKFKTFGRLYVNVDILKGLSFNTALSGSIQSTERSRWQGVEAHRNGAANAQSNRQDEFQSHLVYEAFLNYSKTINKHSFSAIAGFSTENRKHNYSTSTVSGYSFNYIKTLNGGSTIVAASAYEREKRLISYIARVNYAFDDKYLVSLSLRRDGSSVFGSNDKFGNFPAVSVGWRVAEEDFLKKSKVISNLKLRLSYGVTGNDDFRTSGGSLVDWYPYVAILQSTSATVANGSQAGFNAQNIANPNLKWEQSIEINPAIDFGLFNNRIVGSFDYYRRTSNQLLIDQPISTTTGFANALQNIGTVVNEGIEIELRTNNVRAKDFSWSTVFLFSKNQNTLTDFAGANGQITNVDSKRAAEWINQEGYPISSFYGYVYDKDIALEHLNDAFHPIGAEAQDVYVKDLNGDGIIDADDKTILGSPYPDFIWSITNEVFFKNFDLSFMIQGSQGAEVRNMGDQYLYNHFNSAQDYNPATTPDQHLIQQKIFTSAIVQDASYVALRNINLGYVFPKKLMKRVGITRARIYVSAQNLIYLKADGYTGFNPEAIEITSPITYGYQRGGGPLPAKIVFGINLDF